MTDYVAMSGFKSIMLPDDGERDLIFFLAMEEYVAQNFPGGAFFIWRVKPTVIIGRNQDLEAEVNLEYCIEFDLQEYSIEYRGEVQTRINAIRSKIKKLDTELSRIRAKCVKE